jgi:ATP-binding cassette subfamily F protein 3
VYVKLDKIAKSFGPQTLYESVSLQLNKGERWGIVGPNGAGKTTLLKIVMGQESADAGQVTFATGITCGYLEQEMHLDSGRSVLAEVLASATEIVSLEAELTALEAAIATAGAPAEKNSEVGGATAATSTPAAGAGDPAASTAFLGSFAGESMERLLERYGHARDRFEMLGGYELEARCKQILCGLGFHVEELSEPCEEFSGGWKMRIALAKLLLKHPDVLLLDEPTNHLDLESVRWFESFLASYEGVVLIVSHDRAFMDACVSHVAALENRRLTTYTGNYSSYLKQREANLEQLRAKRAAQERDLAHMQVFVDKFRYKPTKAKQVQERVVRMEKIRSELVMLPEAAHKMHFSFAEPPRTGDMVVRCEHVGKRYDTHVVYEDANVTLYRGDHVAIVGPNGAGKSTLLKLIAGKLAPSAGTIELGQNVTTSYYAQHQLENLTPSHTVLQELDSVAPSWTTTEERRLLGAFLFSGDAVEKRVSVLSGGEKARLALAKMLVAPDPLLLLDEPTNHLDIDSVDVLETALCAFAGTIVVISHDEHLVRAVATKVIDVRDGAVTVYDGDYAYYLEKRAALEAAEKDLMGAGAGARGAAAPPGTAAARASAAGAGGARGGFSAGGGAAGAGAAVAGAAGEVAGGGRNVKTKEQRRAEAEARNARSRATAGARKRLAQVDAQLTRDQARYSELMELMASPELYADAVKFDAAMQEYSDLKKSIPALEEEWLELTAAIEDASV